LRWITHKALSIVDARDHLTFTWNGMEALFFYGMDVNKHNHVAVVMNAAGNMTQRAFSIADTHDGMNHLH